MAASRSFGNLLPKVQSILFFPPPIKRISKVLSTILYIYSHLLHQIGVGGSSVGQSAVPSACKCWRSWVRIPLKSTDCWGLVGPPGVLRPACKLRANGRRYCSLAPKATSISPSMLRDVACDMSSDLINLFNQPSVDYIYKSFNLQKNKPKTVTTKISFRNFWL